MAISASALTLIPLLLLCRSSFQATSARAHYDFCAAPLVTADERKTVASSDYGSISAVDVGDGYGRNYHLQFFSLEPQSLLVPLHLHSDMVFYVNSGRGTVNWIGDGESYDVDVKKGDVYRIGSGSVFYVQSHPNPLRQKLRIQAIFTVPASDSSAAQDLTAGAYSNLADLVRGFDEQVLRMGFRVSEEVISALKSVERPPFILPFMDEKHIDGPGWKEGIFEALIGVGRPLGGDNGHKKKKKEKGEEKKIRRKAFNIIEAEPDAENCNGRSIAITDEQFHALKGSDVGVFMVNLTKGSMMGPHWNPRATEIAIVTEGEGMVQVVLPGIVSPRNEGAAECTSWRFRVERGDAFVVPRYHAMAQMSFNNGPFSFVGFSSSVKRNRPQFLAGKRSVLQTLDGDILALSLGVANKTVVEKLLEPQGEAIMLECTSCAEEAEKTAEDMKQIRKREEEEARRREEEEERRREEEEAKRKEEEEARKREEEEERRREEEEGKRKEEEEARKREEEEERRREEEEAKRKEEEARKREEEEERRREEEEARRKEEEEVRRREEEEARMKEKEEETRMEEEESRRREEEEESKRREEEKEEEKRREEEEEARRREQEIEEEERREEEKEIERREQEEEERRKEEEEREEGARREQEKKERRGEEVEAEARKEDERRAEEKEEHGRREQEKKQEERGRREEGEEETPGPEE